MDLTHGVIHPVFRFDSDDTIYVVDEERKEVFIGEITVVDVPEDEIFYQSIPDLHIRWWVSQPPLNLYNPDLLPQDVENGVDPHKNLRLSDRIIQTGDAVVHMADQSRRGIVISMKRKCDIEILDRNQFIQNVDCQKLITNPRGDPPRRVIYKNWFGITKIAQSQVILRFNDGARFICGAAALNKFDAMTHNRRFDVGDCLLSSHDFVIEGLVLKGPVHELRKHLSKGGFFLNSTKVNNALMMASLPPNTEVEVKIEKAITKALNVDWLWNFVSENSEKPPRFFIGKDRQKLTFIDRDDDVWFWGCRYDTVWSYEVQAGDVVIDNNCVNLKREQMLYELYVNKTPTLASAASFYASNAEANSEDRTWYQYTAEKEEDDVEVEPLPQAPEGLLKLSTCLESHMSSSLSQRMKRLRRAKDRDNDLEPDLEPLKEMYESYTAPWDSSRRVRVGQKVPVCVTRTTSLCDVLWADGTLERDLPMDTFGFELFEDYMQGPTFMPGDLVLPPHSANPPGVALLQTDWRDGYGVVLSYSSTARVCLVRWFEVAPDRRSARPKDDGQPTEMGNWTVHRLESVARGVDRNNGLIFWLDEVADATADDESMEKLRVGLLKDIDCATGELVIEDLTAGREVVRLFPCWPGIIPYACMMTETEMMKLASNDQLEFDAQVDEEDEDEDEDDEGQEVENADDDDDDEGNEETAGEAGDAPAVSADDLVNNANSVAGKWKTIRTEDIPMEPYVADISGLLEDFKEHCVSVASLFADSTDINPIRLTQGFVELMDLGLIVVRMYRETKDTRFHAAALNLKSFGATWCQSMIRWVSLTALRRAWPPRDRSPPDDLPGPAEAAMALGHLLSMIGQAAAGVRRSVVSLSQHYMAFPDEEQEAQADNPFETFQNQIPTSPPQPTTSNDVSATQTSNSLPDGATSTPEEQEELPAISFVSDEEFQKYHHFFNEPHEPGRAFVKAWKSDMALLQSSLPAGIFVKACESRMDLFSFLLIGPEDTPFEDSVFHFDICLGEAYPSKPPKVFFYSYIKERLNPNLYPDGKVCLSLLGTWEGKKEGEKWIPEFSNLLQIILSIQGLILNAEPFMNEPGHEKAQDKQRAHYVRLYNEEVVLLGAAFTANLLSRPPPLFRPEIVRHFAAKGKTLVDRLESWCKPEEDIEPAFKPKFSLLPVTRGFQLSMPRYVLELREKLRSILPSS